MSIYLGPFGMWMSRKAREEAVRATLMLAADEFLRTRMPSGAGRRLSHKERGAQIGTLLRTLDVQTGEEEEWANETP